MGRIRGSVSVSLAVLAAAQLLCNPLGHAQEPAPPPEPQVQVQDQDDPGQARNVAPADIRRNIRRRMRRPIRRLPTDRS